MKHPILEPTAESISNPTPNTSPRSIAITTCRLKGLSTELKQGLVQEAQLISHNLQIPYLDRKSDSLEAVSCRLHAHEDNSHKQLLILTTEGLQLFSSGHTISWHPNMLEFRIRSLMTGGTDPMVQAMGLQPLVQAMGLPLRVTGTNSSSKVTGTNSSSKVTGTNSSSRVTGTNSSSRVTGTTILDCTLGYGADAIVAAFAGGPHTSVVGLESNVALAQMTTYGFKNYHQYGKIMPQTQTSMDRIQIVMTDYEDYLPQLPNKSFDIVYFDPMFDEGIEGSKALHDLKTFANMAPLSETAWTHACRIARHYVVVKLPTKSPVHQQSFLKDLTSYGRKGSHIVYLQHRV